MCANSLSLIKSVLCYHSGILIDFYNIWINKLELK